MRTIHALLCALTVEFIPSAAFAIDGIGWYGEIPLASYVDIAAPSDPLVAGRTYTFETRDVRPRGATPYIHLWYSDRFRDVMSSTSCGADVTRACLTYTVPAGQGGNYVLVMRSFLPETAGTADVYFTAPGRSAVPLKADAPFGGYLVSLSTWGSGTSIQAGSVLETVLVPGGAPDTVLYVLTNEYFTGGPANKILYVDDDSNVGLASRLTIPAWGTTQAFALIATHGPWQNGPARLLNNDYLVPRCGDEDCDDDGDRLGRHLEEWGLGTCDRPGRVGGELECADSALRRSDTDGDGLSDQLEAEGGFEGDSGPAIQLPRWGADPVHKDVFVEQDYCENDPLDRIPSRRAPCPAGPQLVPNAAGAGRVAGFYSALPGASIGNPYGEDGVAVHIDVANAGMLPATDTRWGVWGGANCVPRVAEPGTGNMVCPGSDGSRSENQAANRQQVFHYALVGGYNGGGQGDEPGMVFDSGRDPNAFAHELGHNVYVGHAGPPEFLAGVRDAMNCKPHYGSIMNYVFSYSGTHFGFSEGAFGGVPALNRLSLDEVFGLGTHSSASVSFLTSYFGLMVEADGEVDWNRDRGIDRSILAGSEERVRSPMVPNYATISCGLSFVGWQYLGSGVEGMPAVVKLGRTFFVFQIRDGVLGYRTGTDAPDVCDGEWEATGCATWSAVRRVAGSASDPVWSVAADVMNFAGVGDRVVVAFQSSSGNVEWGRIRMVGSTPRFTGESDVLAFVPARSDLEMEVWNDQLWLMYNDGGLPVARLLERRLGRDGAWTTESEARDSSGTILVAPEGVGLARGEHMRSAELLLAAAQIRTTGAEVHLYRYDALAWVEESARLPAVPTTTKPSLVFVPDGDHDNGGWYMLSYRGFPEVGVGNHQRPALLWLSDFSGSFSFLVPPTALSNEWMQLPDDPLAGVAFWRGASGRALGAFVRHTNDDGTIPHMLHFLPYVDGLVRTELRDYDDARGVRSGLCYANHVREEWEEHCRQPCVGCIRMELPAPRKVICP